jgi:uncharacterized protein with HEPN domain
MPGEDADPARLWDLLDHAHGIQAAAKKLTVIEYFANRDARYVIDRYLEMMGEIVKRISAPFKAAHPEIPWSEWVGLRNMLARDYEEVDYTKVWGVIRGEIPVLITKLEPLVPPPPPDPEPNR